MRWALAASSSRLLNVTEFTLRVNGTDTMQVNCRDHRKAMELLGLQMRIKEGISDPKEKKEVEKRIEALEKELEMD